MTKPPSDKHSLSSQQYQQNKPNESVLFLESLYFWQSASLLQKGVVFVVNLLSYLFYIYFSYLDDHSLPWVLVTKALFACLMGINVLVDIKFYRLRMGNLRRWPVIRETFVTAVMMTCVVVEAIGGKVFMIMDKVFGLFLCLRITHVMSYVRFHYLEQGDNEYNSLQFLQYHVGRLKVIDVTIAFFNNLFLCAALILFLDACFSFDLIYPFSPDHPLRYHDAMYFQLITMTTTGYGDMYPRNVQCRVLCIFFILYYCYFFTRFVSIILLSVVNQKNSPPSLRKFDQHTIVIGNLLDHPVQLQQFLNGFYAQSFSHHTKQVQSRLVFIHHGTTQIKDGAVAYQRTFLHVKNTKVLRMQLGNLDWLNDSRIATAQNLLCFYFHNRKKSMDDRMALQQDLSRVLSYVRHYYPRLTLYCTFQSAYIEKQLAHFSKEPSASAPLYPVSCYQLRRNLFSMALVNDGAIGLFHKLVKHSQTIYLKYEHSLSSQPIPPYHRMILMRQIQSYHQFMFLCKVSRHLVGLQVPDINRVLLWLGRRAGQHVMHQNPCVVVGIKRDQEGKCIELVNPQNIILMANDRCYVLANSHDILQYLSTLKYKDIQMALAQIQYQSIDYKIENKFKELFSKQTQDIVSNLRSITDEQNFVTVVDLTCSPAQNLPILQGHFIIIGLSLQFYKKFIMQMNLVTQAALVFVSEQPLDSSFLDSLLKKKDDYNYNFKNIFLVRGDFLSAAQLARLRIEECRKVVVMSKFQAQVNEDIQVQSVYRTLKHFYPQAKVLFELKNASALKLLDARPIQQDTPVSFWPHTVAGNVYLANDVLCQMASANYYDIGTLLLRLFDVQLSYQMIRNHMGHTYHSNSLFSTLPVDEELLALCPTYGDIHAHLLQTNDQVLTIGIVRQQDTKIQIPSLSQHMAERLAQIDKQLCILQNEQGRLQDYMGEYVDMHAYQGERVLLNPGYDFQMRLGDKVYLVGMRGYRAVAEVSCPGRHKSIITKKIRRPSSVLVASKEREENMFSTLREHLKKKSKMESHLDRINEHLKRE